MTKRLIQMELTAGHARAFARDAGRRNLLTVETSRAQHERYPSALAAAYRISNGTRRPAGRAF